MRVPYPAKRGRRPIAALSAVLAGLLLTSFPAGALADAPIYTVREGDTISAIAVQMGVDADEILRLNGLTADALIFPGERLQLPEPAGGSGARPSEAAVDYTVRAGDTLTAIAMRFGVTVPALARANGIGMPNRIFVGQRLAIPARAGSGAPAGDGKEEASGLYIVKEGDTLSEIALRLGVAQSDLMQVNAIQNEDWIIAGQRLRVPARSSSGSAAGEEVVVIAAGETLSHAALRAGVSADVLAAYNDLADPDRVRAGQRLRVPRMADFILPAQGPITVRFGESTPYDPRHEAVDIGVWTGTPVRAMRAGTVTVAGWAFPGEPKRSYGLMVVIDHDRGYSTLYGHLSELRVKAGDWVVAGQVIGLSGATGLVTGPHLHVELRRNGQKLDPLKFVR